MGIFRRSRAANSAFPGRIGPNVSHPRFMVVLLTSNNEEDPIKNEGIELTKLFINFSVTQGQLTPHSVVESVRNSYSPKLL